MKIYKELDPKWDYLVSLYSWLQDDWPLVSIAM